MRSSFILSILFFFITTLGISQATNSSKGTDFAEAAAKEASQLQKEMAVYLEEKGII
ncbi:hypothetical protein OAX36_06685 [Flavobacteriaceae bacterium]|nr:hypothetical protein [Flavobacteriaceae bacterium]